MHRRRSARRTGLRSQASIARRLASAGGRLVFAGTQHYDAHGCEVPVRIGADRAQHVETAHARHAVVEYHEVRKPSCGFQGLQRRRAIRGAGHGETCRGALVLEDLAIGGVVVDDHHAPQDPRLSRRSRGFRVDVGQDREAEGGTGARCAFDRHASVASSS
jgi:hypothetical protein